MLAVREDELTGPEVRRWTRRAAAARADTTLWTRLGDALGTLTSIGVGIAVVGGSVASLRERVLLAGPPVTAAHLPGALVAAAAGVMGLAALLVLLDRLGPVSATPAVAAWWLPLPAGRGGLLAGELRRVTTAAVVPAVLLTFPVLIAVSSRPSAAGVLGGTAVVAGTVATAVGAVALVQTRGGTGHLAAVAGGLAVLPAVLAAVLGTLGGPAAALAAGLPRPSLPAWAAAVPLVAALALLAAAVRRLDRLPAGQLRARGTTASYAAASAFTLDARDLGRALAARRTRGPARSRTFGRVTRPWQAVVAGDVTTLLRGRWQLGQLAVAVAVPVVVARTAGLGTLRPAVWLGFVLGGALAATAAGHPARQAQAAPVLDRLLPLSPVEVARARMVLPLVLTTVVCGAAGTLVALGSGTVAWALLVLGTAPTWAAAAVRGAYRPELDWSGQVMATPMGPVPVGAGATLVNGPDVGVVGTLPLLVALLGAGPTPGLVVFQLLWSAGLAAGAVALTGRRLSRRS
jgi:Family of unknown function (DUF6297)